MKDYLKIFAFGTIFLIILAVLSAIFNGRFWYNIGYVADRDARYAAIELEEPGQIEVLNVGNSLCDVSLIPLELYRDYGITSYNMGRDLQSKAGTYYAIKTAMQRQKIKVVLWETDNLCKHKSDRKGRRTEEQEDRLKDTYKDDLEPYREEVAEFYYYHFPALRYHSSWRNWLNGTRHAEFYKGFQIRKETVKPDHKKDQADGNEQSRAERLRAKIDRKNELTFKMDQMHAFNKIYNLCQANGIKLILYSAPSEKYYITRRRHDAITKLAKKYGIDYIDGNFDEGIVGIDWDRDSFDGGGHLNLYGSRKMTKYLGEYLSKHCDLTDHRGDPAYAEWADMEKYEAECGE